MTSELQSLEMRAAKKIWDRLSSASREKLLLSLEAPEQDKIGLGGVRAKEEGKELECLELVFWDDYNRGVCRTSGGFPYESWNSRWVLTSWGEIVARYGRAAKVIGADNDTQ